jgi:poly-gamma-glutamate system protein
MKRLYWRPRRVSRAALLIISLLSVAGVAAVETLPVKNRQPYYSEMLAAARLAERAMDVVKTERILRDLPLDPEADPAGSGLIGQLMSPVTSHTGYLNAKQTSVNPNFAAVIVHQLKRAGVNEGDVVAVGLTGSFPALNIAVLAALETVKAKPIAISSVAASQWGANFTELMWPDMERLLFDKRVFSCRSVAASRGGIEDRGLGMSKEGRKLLDECIARAGLRQLMVKSYADSVEQRMALYEEEAAGAPIRAYINVGGGTSSVGTRVGKKTFVPGLNLGPPRGSLPVDSVMSRFAHDGVPVIHLVRIDDLAHTFGLPTQPDRLPVAGQGNVFQREEYNRLLAGGALAGIFAVLFAFIRMDLGFRILQPRQRDQKAVPPEPMV